MTIGNLVDDSHAFLQALTRSWNLADDGHDHPDVRLEFKDFHFELVNIRYTTANQRQGVTLASSCYSSPDQYQSVSPPVESLMLGMISPSWKWRLELSCAGVNQ